MPTIIDEFIVRLGVDASDFDKGQKAAIAAFLKTRDEAKKTGDDIENSSKRSADAIDRVTKSALGLFAVLLGANSLKDFAVNITQTDAAVGRLSTNLGLSARNLQAWQAAFQRVGGTAEGASSSASTANSQLMNARINGGIVPTSIARLFADAGMGSQIGQDIASGNTQQYMLDLAQAYKVTADRQGTSTAAYLLQSGGFDPSFGNLALQQGGPGMQGYLNKMPVASDATIKQMQETQNQWASLQQQVSQDAGSVVGDLEKVATPFLSDFQQLADGFSKFEPTLSAFADDAEKLAQSSQGFRIVVEGLVALWAGGKLLGLIGAASRLLGAAPAADAAGGGVLAWLGGIATGAVSAAAGTAAGAAATVGGLAGAAWLASAGPAGAGEGDLVRQINAGGNRGAGGSWWTPERQALAYSRLTKEGLLSPVGARALIARWMGVESPGGPGSINPTSGAFGIGQWLGDRKGGINGDTDFNDQLSYVLKELNSQGPNGAAGFALRQAGTAQQGAIGASMYERAAGYNPSTGADNFTAATMAAMHAAGAARSAQWAMLMGRGGSGSRGAIAGVTVNGGITVHTQAKTPDGIANATVTALKRATMAQQANYGPN